MKCKLSVEFSLDNDLFKNLPIDDEFDITTELYNRVQQFLEDYSFEIFDNHSFERFFAITGIIKDNKIYIYIDKPEFGIEKSIFDYTFEDDFTSKQLKALIDYTKYLLFIEIAYLALPDCDETKCLKIKTE